MKNAKELSRIKRHKRLRKKIMGDKERPRMSIHRSLTNLYVQFVDDLNQKTICSVSTLDPKLKGAVKKGGNLKAAEALGAEAALTAKSKGISKVVLDRGGYIYHGRIKAFADAARKNGLSF
ncbi:MAG: 50S ribosomal protein L18 [Candidatus Omnitrophota bacterium]|nr:50S ribosomal protein L18 [Candidatus Omnitrophota bacterium]